MGRETEPDVPESDLEIKISCTGEEFNLGACRWSDNQQFSGSCRNPVAIACQRPSYALCPEKQEPYGDSCYEIHEDARDFKDAQVVCEHRGGHLLEINDEAESDFVSEWVGHLNRREEFPLRETRFWIGGLVTSAAGKTFLVWHHSKTPVTVEKFVDFPDKALSVEKAIMMSKINNYLFWTTADLDQTSSFICESPMLNIGCLEEANGADYKGKASRSSSGEECLAWSGAGLKEIFEGQSSWHHNYCRNPNGEESDPFCFTSQEEFDYCDIPKCGDVNRRDVQRRRQQQSQCPVNLFSESDRSVSSGTTDLNRAIATTTTSGSRRRITPPPSSVQASTCGKERFECSPGECIFASHVCDGDPDCASGEDEVDCMTYTKLFDLESGFKLQSNEEVINGISAEECAKKCLQTKHCSCTSFSHHPTKSRCLLANRNSANNPYDALLEKKSWNYYKLNGSASVGCDRVRRPAGTTPFEAIRLVAGREADIVEVKVNGTWGGVCDDGFSFNEAHVVCYQLGYELGAEQVVNGQGKRGDIINVYDMECEGEERHISDCRFGDHESHHHVCEGTEKAGVR